MEIIKRKDGITEYVINTRPFKNDEERKKTSTEILRDGFRIRCINPIRNIYGENDLCNHGTCMTIEEMNNNIIWKSKPYIKIPYCKYCYTKNTIGVFDDTPELIGWEMMPPNNDNPIFILRELPEKAFDQIRKYFRKFNSK